jgi:hypothetical protein
MTEKIRFNILYTEIGRGHPFYLDGICDQIGANHSGHIESNIIDVFEISKGLSLLLWKLIRFMYQKGSQGGLWGWLYVYARRQNQPRRLGMIEKILACHIRNYLRKNPSPTIVAHPILVPMISDIVDVYYQHGEISVPSISIVSGIRMIFVPLEETYQKFIEKGLSRDRVVVTGLCLERFLVQNAESDFRHRLSRLNSCENLVGGFFSSGAEPIEHIKKMVRALISLEKYGQMGLVFCKSGGKFEGAVLKQIQAKVYKTALDDKSITEEIKKNKILIFSHSNRQTENKNIQTLFKYLDYFVSPSHERSNWAIGLGIPMFVLHPLIGPFSPINRNILLRCNVADDIISEDDANNFSKKLRLMTKSGKLRRMAESGYGKCRINGFETVVSSLNKQIYKN